jgi:hypothetical protein
VVCICRGRRCASRIEATRGAGFSRGHALARSLARSSGVRGACGEGGEDDERELEPPAGGGAAGE